MGCSKVNKLSDELILKNYNFTFKYVCAYRFVKLNNIFVYNNFIDGIIAPSNFKVVLGYLPIVQIEIDHRKRAVFFKK